MGDVRLTVHKWADVRGWGGALPGTVQCDRCNRVVSPTDPKGAEKMASGCGRTADSQPAQDSTAAGEMDG